MFKNLFVQTGNLYGITIVLLSETTFEGGIPYA